MALTLILVGLLLLLNNFNLIPWNFWYALWKFWPVLLIVWGLELISGKYWVGRIFTVLLFFVLTLSVFGFALSHTNTRFNNWLKLYLPQWESWQNQLPEDQPFPLPSPFNQNGRKIFRCDPETGECKAIYK